MSKSLSLTCFTLFVGLTVQAVQAQKIDSSSNLHDEGISACNAGLIGNTGQCEDKLPKAIKEETAKAVPSETCRPGFNPQGTRLCMTNNRGPAQFAEAVLICQRLGARVADYGDWHYRFIDGDGVSAPVSFWLGPNTGDNEALFVNMSNPNDFDGVTSRFDNRNFACAHDRTA